MEAAEILEYVPGMSKNLPDYKSVDPEKSTLGGFDAVRTSAPCPGGSTLDPTTGICWSENSPSDSLGGSGNIPCLPGRLGLCLGALQNIPVPGSALQTTYPPAGPAPRSGPMGTRP